MDEVNQQLNNNQSFLKPTRLTWKIFIFLVVLTAVVVAVVMFSEIDTLQMILYVGVMLPAVGFDFIGLPAITLLGGWFAGPTTFGFILVIIVYLILFYLIACLANRIKSRGISKKILIGLGIIILLVAGYYVLDYINTPDYYGVEYLQPF